MDERSRLLDQAEHCRRIAEKINHPETAEALRNLAREYLEHAEALSHHDNHKEEGKS